MLLIKITETAMRFLFKTEQSLGRLRRRMYSKTILWKNIDWERRYGHEWYEISDEDVPPFKVRKQQWVDLCKTTETI